jgi:carbonic anhydrase
MNLKAQPAVAKALAHGELAVRGWFYDILTGRIEEYDENARRFVPFGE